MLKIWTVAPGGNGVASIARRGVADKISIAAWVVGLSALACFMFPRPTLADGEVCPNEQFRAGPGASLPDCRAYEQASPPNKNGGQIEGAPSDIESPEDGSGITWFSISGTGPIASGGSTAGFPTYFSKRNAGTWLTQRLNPPLQPPAPRAPYQESIYLGMTPDGHYSVASANNSECAGFQCASLWVINNQTEAATLITSTLGNPKFAFDGASQDGSQVFFESKQRLASGAVQGVSNVYMWSRDDGSVSLVGVPPESTETPEAGAFGGPYDWTQLETYAGGASYGMPVGAIHAISPSGDQIYFTEGESGQLYLRRGLNGATPATIRVSEPNDGVSDPNGPQPAAFLEATPTGSRAFFMSSAHLAEGANTGPGDQGKDLYRFDSEAPVGERLTDVTPDINLDTPDGAEVVGFLGASSAGNSGYFVARGVLADGGTAGEYNIYRFDETSPGHFLKEFVATLNPSPGYPGDEANWVPWAQEPGEGNYIAAAEGKASRVTPDGSALLFTSFNPITGFADESGFCGASELANRPDGPSGGKLCKQIYLFSTETHSVKCLSCNPQGISLGGDAFNGPTGIGPAGLGPFQKPAASFTRNLSSNGKRAFFESTESLSPADSSGGRGCSRGECADVYEWEAVAEGSCRSASPEYSSVAGGCVFLVSPAGSPIARSQASYFLDASSDGTNVFIATNNPLVSTDVDEAFDAYDVSVDGGIPSQRNEPTAGCAGEECLGPATSPPSVPSLASKELAGPGNVDKGRPRRTCPKKRKDKSCTHRKGSRGKKPNHKRRASGNRRHGDHQNHGTKES